MSFGDYVKSKGDSEKDSGRQRKKLRATIEDRLTVDGACGRVLRFMDLNLEDGQTYKWYFLHPCALLCELCKVCGSLGDLINQVHQGTLQLAFYQDEIKPGKHLETRPGSHGLLLVLDHCSATAVVSNEARRLLFLWCFPY